MAQEPSTGMQKSFGWMQFMGSMQFRLPLRGDQWEGIEEKDFEVKVSSQEISVRCRTRSQDLDDLSGRFRREVNPKACWYAVERDVRDPTGQNRVLTIEVAKKEVGKAWPQEGIFLEQMFNRKFFGWNKETKEQEDDVNTLRTLKPGRPADLDDPFVTSRGWLCNELCQGQTAEILQFQIILDEKKLNESMEKVPYYKQWGVDISEKYIKVFIRGDEASPVLMGALGGKCVPDATTIHLDQTTRPVKGHRIQGTMETFPCLEITILKAQDSMTEWDELLSDQDQDLNSPQGTLEEFEEKTLRNGRAKSPDREDWTPDDWADEQKEKADAAFKDGSFRDAIVYYTRALRFTPYNEKLLCNRSAGYLKISKCQLALDDALKAEEIEPRWAKVFFRKGQALRGLKRFDESLAAFGEGLAIDPGSPEWEKEIKRTHDAQAAHAQKRGGARAARD